MPLMPGDLLLWDSRLVHCGRDGPGMNDLISSPLARPPSGEALATQLVLWSPGMGSCATLFESDRRRRLVFRTRTAACCRRGRALQEFILSTLVNS